MAGYDSSKLDVVFQAMAGPRVWFYRSVDAPSLVQVSGYITDAGKRGMKVGDVVIAQDNDTSPYQTSTLVVVTVNATTGAADLSNAVSIGGASNSD